MNLSAIFINNSTYYNLYTFPSPTNRAPNILDLDIVLNWVWVVIIMWLHELCVNKVYNET